MVREGAQQPGDETRSGGSGAKVEKVEKVLVGKVEKVEKVLVGKVEKVEKVEKLNACFGRCRGAATSWPFIGKYKERCLRCLFRSEM